MRNLSDLLLESSANLTQRRKELLKYFKGKSYEAYVNTLNEMCKDPKSKALIDAAFGGELGDVKLKMNVLNIPATKLMPTQNEIDSSKSLSRSMKPNADLAALYANTITLGIPLVTFNGGWVIDGHHRWSQVMCYNPEGKMACINFDGNISPIQMLKAVQGAIAAAEGELPSNKVTGMNIYDMDEKSAKEYFDEHLTEEVYENFKQFLPEVESIEAMKELFTNNVLEFINDHPLMKFAPERGVMPQTDKSHDGNVSDPDSALGKIVNDKVLKVPGTK